MLRRWRASIYSASTVLMASLYAALASGARRACVLDACAFGAGQLSARLVIAGQLKAGGDAADSHIAADAAIFITSRLSCIHAELSLVTPI